MDVLKIENNYSWFISKNEDVKAVIWKALRFRDRGYYHNVRYKMKIWDGYTDFFKKDTGRFLTGLLPEVKLALKSMKVEYVVEDRRENFNFLYNEVDENFLNDPSLVAPIVLRDYQVDYINKVLKNKRGIIPSPTSSGKTSVMTGIIKCLPPGTPTLVLANKKQLVEQNYDEIRKMGVADVGRFYGGAKQPNIITCSTVQSAHLLDPLLPKIKALIVDEIHEMMSKKPRQIYNKLKNCVVRVGMSATAFKFGGADKTQKYEVKGWIGPMFTAECTDDGMITTKELQERNILAKSICFFYPIEKPQLPYDIYLDAVTRGIAENEHLHEIVVRLAKKQKGRTLILVDRISHGDRLKELIPSALWVQGKDDMATRKEVVRQLKESDSDVIAIATQQIFNTGLNVYIHNLVNTAGGKADHQIIQRIGRGLRVAGDKEKLLYYDFVFNINDYLREHSLKRMNILKKQGHEVLLKEIDF